MCVALSLLIRPGSPRRAGEKRSTVTKRHHAVQPEPAIMQLAAQIRRAMGQQIVQKCPAGP